MKTGISHVIAEELPMFFQKFLVVYTFRNEDANSFEKGNSHLKFENCRSSTRSQIILLEEYVNYFSILLTLE